MTDHSPIIAPFAHPLYMMVKPAGSLCNLACEYCYYKEKNELYPEEKNQILSNDLLEYFIRQYLESQTMTEVLFTWHGGEPLMRPLSFYRKALELERKYAGGRTVANCIQTNGTLLNDDWCRFFKDNDFLVGISIDGPQTYHDEYRRNRQGLPSFFKVMKGINLLKKYDVAYNAMAVVNDCNADDPVAFYSFFKSIDCRYIQFAPVVERIGWHANGTSLSLPEETTPQLAPFSVDGERWGNFLCGLFDEWLKNDVGEYFIQIFDSTLANWVGEQPGVCTMAKRCGHAGVMEFNGDVYSCDHYVFPEYRLGNIRQQTLTEMMYSERQQKFGADKQETLPRQCRECDYLFACNGGCPKDRFLISQNNERGINYLCKGYLHFFSHVAPYMDYMKRELLAKRPPSNVMEWARTKKT